MPLTPEAKALRDLRKEGKEAVVALEALIEQLDITYKLPPSSARDKTIATLTSKIEYAKDCLKRFGLKMELGRPAKKQPANPVVGKPVKPKHSPAGAKTAGAATIEREVAGE